MPQSLSVVYVHLVFSTKHRLPFLHDRVLREQTHAYLGEISKRLGCTPRRVGGVEDHVHLLASLNRTTTMAGWVKELKRASTRWLREQATDGSRFEWQSGYGVFSVSQSNAEQVIHYIENQEQHHRKQCFQDELRTLLRRHNAVFDERYLWD